MKKNPWTIFEMDLKNSGNFIGAEYETIKLKDYNNDNIIPLSCGIAKLNNDLCYTFNLSFRLEGELKDKLKDQKLIPVNISTPDIKDMIIAPTIFNRANRLDMVAYDVLIDYHRNDNLDIIMEYLNDYNLLSKKATIKIELVI